MLSMLVCAVLGIGCPDQDLPPVPRVPVVAKDVVAASIAIPSAKPAKTHATFSFDPNCSIQPPPDLRQHFVAAARRHIGYTDCELSKQAFAESSFRSDAVSPAGAIGLCQLLPDTAEWLGADPWDPRESIFAMAKMDLWCMQRFDPHAAGRTQDDINAFSAVCYNWGVGSMYKSQRKHGWMLYRDAKPYFPEESVAYVGKVFGL